MIYPHINFFFVLGQINNIVLEDIKNVIIESMEIMLVV